ncbi:MAG: hypothetical protein IKE45_16670 [Halomonas sp.]|nr:hypothetical protein [Halomonas sp.]MBR2515610.1 hypothetical protein [Halomonas sp.]
MDKQTKFAIKRPRVLTLCMLAATVSTLALAGCGDNDDELPPAQQPEAMEQDATTNGQAPAMGDDPAMTDDPGMQDPAMDDPALDDNAASSQEPMPGEEPGMNATDQEPGFGEGAEPMPGADDDDDELTQGQ